METSNETTTGSKDNSETKLHKTAALAMESGLSVMNSSRSGEPGDKDNTADSKTFAVHPSVIGISTVFAVYALFLVIYYLVFSQRKNKQTKVKLSSAPVDDIMSDNWLNHWCKPRGSAFSVGFQNTDNELGKKRFCNRMISSLSDMDDLFPVSTHASPDTALVRKDKFQRCKSVSVFLEHSNDRKESRSNSSTVPHGEAVLFTVGPFQGSSGLGASGLGASGLGASGLSASSQGSPEAEEANRLPVGCRENSFTLLEGAALNRCSSSKSSITRSPSYHRACTSHT